MRALWHGLRQEEGTEMLGLLYLDTVVPARASRPVSPEVPGLFHLGTGVLARSLWHGFCQVKGTEVPYLLPLDTEVLARK